MDNAEIAAIGEQHRINNDRPETYGADDVHWIYQNDVADRLMRARNCTFAAAFTFVSALWNHKMFCDFFDADEACVRANRHRPMRKLLRAWDRFQADGGKP